MVLKLVGVLENGSPRAPGVPENPRETLRIPKGASLTLQVRAVRPDGSAVVGGTLIWTVKKSATDYDYAFKKEGAAVAEFTELAVLPQDTKNLPAGRYVYDVWYKDVADNVEPVVGLSPIDLQNVARR